MMPRKMYAVQLCAHPTLHGDFQKNRLSHVSTTFRVILYLPYFKTNEYVCNLLSPSSEASRGVYKKWT